MRIADTLLLTTEQKPNIYDIDIELSSQTREL